MTRPRITKSLKGMLGEVYYKELCDQRGWAYCSLENIYNSKNNDILEFKKGFSRIKVKIPPEIQPEIQKISTPSNNSPDNPSFVFDYLACKVGNYTDFSKVQNPREFCWAEVKTGEGIFSDNQFKVLQEIQLPIAVFHIEDVLDKPNFIEMDWNMMSGKELASELEEIDDF